VWSRPRRHGSNGELHDGAGLGGRRFNVAVWPSGCLRQAVRRSSWAKSEDRVRRIRATLGDLPLDDLDYRTVTEWQATLARTLSPWTVRHHRLTLAQVVDEAVKMGALVGNPVRAVRPIRIGESEGVALDRGQTSALLDAVRDHRLGAAVAMLFLQGWRVSEVLGLAWEDLDLDASTAQVRRASVYVDGRGQQLGPTKTDGARGENWLMPAVVELLERRRELQVEERSAAPTWATIAYQGRPVDLVFSTPTGGLVLRQTVAKVGQAGGQYGGHRGQRSARDPRWPAQRCHDVARRRRGSAGGHRPVRRPCQADHDGGLRKAPRSAPSGRR
jgi:integrase